MNFVPGIDWYQLKLCAQHATEISMDALHVVAGVALQLLIALLFRSSAARPLPLLAVLLLALANEANDFRIEIWPDLGMQLGEAAKDVILTMVLPTLIFLVARRRPRLLVHRSSWRASGSSDSS